METSLLPTPTSILFPLLIQPRDSPSTTASPSPTTTSIHLSTSQILHEEFWPYGASVLIAFAFCVILFGSIWLLDKTYEAKEFGLNVFVWLWGTWWTIVFWPFEMLAKVNRVLNRGLGRDAEGRVIVPRDMEEC